MIGIIRDSSYEQKKRMRRQMQFLMQFVEASVDLHRSFIDERKNQADAQGL